jgi:hypothetical protein
LLQERYKTAMSVFDHKVLHLGTTIKTCPAPAARAAACSAARAELIEALQRAQDTMVVQLQARVAVEQARQAAAEKQRMEQEQKRERQIQQAKKAAITEYQERMKRVMVLLENMSMPKLMAAHQVSKQPAPFSTPSNSPWY